jgi:hypothetical protein
LAEEWELLAAAPDAFLNRTWARGNAACFLYGRRTPPSRVQIIPQPGNTVRILERNPQHWRIEVNCKSTAVLEIADLPYAGWEASIFPTVQPPIAEQKSETMSGITLDSVTSPSFHRLVSIPSGRSTVLIGYRPYSLHIGVAISTTTMLLLTALCMRPLRS